MALPSSGAISLNQMHVEAGGSSGSQVSLNDSDIRDMISKSSGSQMSFSEWYGASSGPAIERSYTGGGSTNSNRTYSMWWGYSGFAGNYGGSEIYWSGTKVADMGAQSTIDNMNYDLVSYVTFNGTTTPVKNNVPFPAHTSAISGWWYYNKRGDTIQNSVSYDDDFDQYYAAYYHANRVDSNSSYPH